MSVEIEVLETVVQRSSRNVGASDCVHRREIFGREVSAKRSKWCARAASGARCSVAGRIKLAVQLIELMFAVQRRSLLRNVVDCSLCSLWSNIDECVVVVDRQIGGDENRYG
jgi:hypothetical protein